VRRRATGTRWFALIGFALYGAAFVGGNLLYPTYKVRVRAEYLEMPSAVTEDVRSREAARAEIRRRAGDAPETRTIQPARLSGVARAFDVKEHWAALGLPLAAGALALTRRWNPKTESVTSRRLLLLCTGGAALCAWLAMIIGLVVTSYRSVGGLA
jgi:hypothetical protein